MKKLDLLINFLIKRSRKLEILNGTLARDMFWGELAKYSMSYVDHLDTHT